jgi:hypothetical protein
MLRAAVVTTLGVVAITVPALMNIWPAIGQSLIGASNIDKYSQYYAPYAIQAAAAYVSVGQMESKKLSPAEANQYAIDEIFTDSSVDTRSDENEGMTADKIRSQALGALQPWQYYLPRPRRQRMQEKLTRLVAIPSTARGTGISSLDPC